MSSSQPGKLPESARTLDRQAAVVALLAASLLASLGLLELGLRAFFVAPAALAAHYPLGQGVAGADLPALQPGESHVVTLAPYQVLNLKYIDIIIVGIRMN